MEDVKSVLKELVLQKKEEYENAYAEFKRVMDNPNHTAGEMIDATKEFNVTLGRYNGVMEALLKLYELGLV